MSNERLATIAVYADGEPCAWEDSHTNVYLIDGRIWIDSPDVDGKMSTLDWRHVMDVDETTIVQPVRLEVRDA